jgi:hypothetical protein
MSAQQSLFSASNLARTVQVPAAPNQLTPHTDWPYPGMTPEDSARASLVQTDGYQEMLASVVKASGCARITTREVLARVPADWRDLCGQYAHATLSNWTAKKHGIQIIYVPHESSGGFHFEYGAEAVGAA